MLQIHPTSVVDRQAVIGEDVEIGPNCYVGPKVVLGSRCRLYNNVTLMGKAAIGERNEFFPGAVIGAPPQDLKYRGGDTEVIIGDDNVFRECVTAHTGTEVAGGITRIGNHNRFLVGCHLAHDVVVGDHCILANHVQLAGHVHIEDRVTMGGLTGVHHFVTIGTLSYIAGLSRITVDVPPFMIIGGEPARVRGVNITGMSRWKFDDERIQCVRELYKRVFSKRIAADGGSMLEKLAAFEQNGSMNDDTRRVCEFIRRSSRDGVFGRYLESARCDTDEDRRRFYAGDAANGDAANTASEETSS